MSQISSVLSFAWKVLRARDVEAPKFEEIVKVVIATFAVFTGVAIKDYVTSNVLGDLHWVAFVALVSLLLRYIIGSGVHLTYTYARKDATPAEPNSGSVFLLAKDFGFVVYFGFVAVQMAKATDFAAFWLSAQYFLIAGLIWSVTDCAIRYFWSQLPGNENEWPRRQFWLLWAALDGVQLLLTWGIPKICPIEAYQAVALAIVYAIFLLLDLKVMARTLQVKLPKEPSAGCTAPGAADPRS
jgi:hypothetical protein